MATGHLEKRSKGNWSMVIDYGREIDPETGKSRQVRHRRSLKNMSKAQARAILNDTLARINQGIYVEPIEAKVWEYMKQWVTDTAAPSVKPRTREGYESIVRRHIKPSLLGQMQMCDVWPEHVRAFHTELAAKGLAVSTRRGIHVVLRAGFRQAVADGKMPRDPMTTVKAPKGEMGQGRDLTDEEVELLLDEAAKIGIPKGRNGQKWLCSLDEVLWTALATGARRGEFLALWKEDLHLVHGQGKVSITRALSSVSVEPGKRHLDLASTKSLASVREVPIDDTTVDMLQDLADRNPHSFLFCHTDGTPLDPPTVTHLVTRITRRLGLEGASLHSTRHTFCTRALHAGVDIVTTQEMAGHGSITTTRRYSHSRSDRKREAANLIGRSLKLDEHRLSTDPSKKQETQP